MTRLRIAYIARAYPPTLGGMENFAQQLREHLEAFADVAPVINHRGKKALPAFLPYAAARAIHLARSGQVDAVHLADALLAPVGAAVKAASGVPVTSSVCGLDVTYTNRAYQAVVPRALRRLDAVMPISAATDAAMRARTGDGVTSHVIPLGINPLVTPATMPDEIAALLPRLEGRRVLITAGRLIERKGHGWFVRAVLPLLAPDSVYLIVGTGPQHETTEAAAREAGVADRVVLAGRVSDAGLAAAYALADVFVMPNVPVPGDMEGFGLVALEASASGLPVIAANLEGITEAVHHGRNGLLVPPRDAGAFAGAITGILDRGTSDRATVARAWSSYTRTTFGWPQTAERYARVIESIARPRTIGAASRSRKRAA